MRRTDERSVSLIFGAYNEEKRLPALLEHLRSAAERELGAAGLRYEEAIVVDDGSVDRTAEQLRAGATADPRLRPLFPWTRNRGKGAAMKAGIEVASGDLVLLVDVDLSTPLPEIVKLIAAERANRGAVVIGSRVLEGSDVIAPLHRRRLGSAFNFFVRQATGLDLTDTQAGFKLLETGTARELMGDQVAPGFAFDVELLLRARLAGLPVIEVPVRYIHDSRSRVRVVRSGLRMALDVARISARFSRASAQLSGERGRASEPSANGDRTGSSSDRS